MMEPDLLGERSRLERDAMAWPPASWEREPQAWRDDVDYGADANASVGPGTAVLEPAPRRPAMARLGPVAREAFETLFLTALIFVGIRLVVQNFRIEGRSMQPTLHDGEYLLVNKMSYAVFGAPQRGDIIVFQAWGQDKDFIKRVVGRPGDDLEIRDNRIFVNEVAVDEPYLTDGTTGGPGGVIHLEDDQYYVLGDNRGNSSDSRTYGPLPGERIIG
ncbi:MAG: signal peptidase I, partial [Anaerolineae bacterium]